MCAMDRVPPSPRSHPWPQRSQAPRWCGLRPGETGRGRGCRYLRPASRDESGSEPLPDPEVRPCWYLGRSRCRKCGVAGTSGPLPRRSSWDEHSASMSTFWRLLIMASLTWAMSGCPPARRPSKIGGGYQAAHLSSAPLRPGEAFWCCSAAAPSVAPLRPATQCGPAAAWRSGASQFRPAADAIPPPIPPPC